MTVRKSHTKLAAELASRPDARADSRLSQPSILHAFRALRVLVGGYLLLSLLTVVAIVVMRNDKAAVDSSAWTRGIIVAVGATLTYILTVRAAHGSRGAFRRLRIISAITVVVIGVIIALPGTIPLWLKIEQGICGVLLVVVVVLVNRTDLRTSFTDE